MSANQTEKPILVTRSSLPPFEEFTEMLKPIWESRWLTNMGDYHQELEQRLREYLGADQLVLFTNGHMALEMVIQAMELTGEVITTPFTFASTTHAIVRNGLTPVFCDINPRDYTMDVDKICLLYTSYHTMVNTKKFDEIYNPAYRRYYRELTPRTRFFLRFERSMPGAYKMARKAFTGR